MVAGVCGRAGSPAPPFVLIRVMRWPCPRTAWKGTERARWPSRPPRGRCRSTTPRTLCS